MLVTGFPTGGWLSSWAWVLELDAVILSPVQVNFAQPYGARSLERLVSNQPGVAAVESQGVRVFLIFGANAIFSWSF